MSQQINSMTMQEFIRWLATYNNIPIQDAASMYNMVINGIKHVVANNIRLELYGFGVFYLQLHKGHKMQFQAKPATMDNYLVFKFSASSSLNKHIRNGTLTDKDDTLLRQIKESEQDRRRVSQAKVASC